MDLTEPDIPALKRILNDWALGLQAGGGWNALFWNNHDQPRAINRFGDPDRYHYESATMLATAIHLLRGTPYIYMGEEIGMTDPDYTRIEDYVDVEARNAYAELVAAGHSEADAFAVVHAKARDNARTPMQWDATAGAGFTTGTPWLRPTNAETINVAAEEAGGRILPYYRRLVELRKTEPVIAEGDYAPWELDSPDVFAYIRSLPASPDAAAATSDDAGPARLLVLTSFRGHPTTVAVPSEFLVGEVLIGNYPARPLGPVMTLSPYEALAIIIRNPKSL
nr:alpha-amylase family glycosyl hydrolase [Actinomyces ruminis]